MAVAGANGFGGHGVEDGRGVGVEEAGVAGDGAGEGAESAEGRHVGDGDLIVNWDGD